MAHMLSACELFICYNLHRKEADLVALKSYMDKHTDFNKLKKLNIEKFNKLPMHIIDKMLDLHINSKAIFTYIFLCSLAHVIDDYEYVYVPDINCHKLYLLMRENNINTSYRQIANSLEELKSVGLINFAFSYEKNMQLSIIDLIDAYVDVKKKYEDSHRQYRSIPKILLSERFYSLGVQGKRLFLYLYNNVVFSNTPIRNILNPETYSELCNLLRLNRPQKIREAIEKVADLIDIIKLDARKKVETFMFKLKDIAKDVLDSTSEVVPLTKKVLDRIITFFEKNDYTYDIKELKQIAAATRTWSIKKLYKGLSSYLKAKCDNRVTHIMPYFRKLSYTLYFQELN